MEAKSRDGREPQGAIEGGLDHRLTFVGKLAVDPTKNATENALREPVVLRKSIGTLRTKNGVIVHETLLATWKQQKRNIYDAFKRTVRDPSKNVCIAAIFA